MKGNLKGESREITEKEGQPKGRRNGFGRSYRKGFYGGWSVFLFLCFCAGCSSCNTAYSAPRIDWISQHSTRTDYFRKRFYATGNLFPDFACESGVENIYRFAYGLLSPTVLSILHLPFIPMDATGDRFLPRCCMRRMQCLHRWISKRVCITAAVTHRAAHVFLHFCIIPIISLCLSIICRFCCWLC